MPKKCYFWVEELESADTNGFRRFKVEKSNKVTGGNALKSLIYKD